MASSSRFLILPGRCHPAFYHQHQFAGFEAGIFTASAPRRRSPSGNWTGLPDSIFRPNGGASEAPNQRYSR
ncbi:hypothetical protein KCP76_09675 [Salmonella enterica subsp. enterica serovar Weltevreden]|nr:hypothetical protein KCP76_09675 [Salmonella enterica subsp. enterica serovar Weltevreden]